MKYYKLYVDYGRDKTRITDIKGNVLDNFNIVGNISAVSKQLYKLAKEKGYELYIDTKVLGIVLYEYLLSNYKDIKVHKC